MVVKPNFGLILVGSCIVNGTIWSRRRTRPARAEREGLSMIRKLFRSRKGATAIEYGLIAALIAVAAIAAMQGLGNQLTKTFTNVSENMKAS
jgi:pilus assembly protein Flp/PilA